MLQPDPNYLAVLLDEPEDEEVPPYRRWKLSEVVAEGLEYRWLVQGMLLADSYGITAGELKSLKSWIGLARDVGIAAGIPVLGAWHVPERRRVLVYAGEGGRKLLTRRVMRLAAAYGIPLTELDDWLQIVDDIGPLTGETFRTRLNDHLRDWQPALVHLDPLYPYQPTGIDSHRYAEVGQMLTGAQRLCAEHDAMFWTTVHMNQSGQGFDLKRIAGAGHGEWGDSWMLVKHRQAPDVARGSFRLLVDIGSRQWGGGSWDLDFNIGRFDADLGAHDGDVSWTLRTARTAGEVDQTEDPLVDVKLEILRVGRKARKPLTRQGWLARVERRAELKRSAFDELVGDGSVTPGDDKGATFKVAEGR